MVTDVWYRRPNAIGHTGPQRPSGWPMRPVIRPGKAGSTDLRVPKESPRRAANLARTARFGPDTFT
jgi:hypothetical protein